MSEVVLDSCDPRDREAEIKELFTCSGKSAFTDVFDRTYRPRADQGLRSWFCSTDGQVVMHISVTPMRFVGGGHTQRCGLLSDLMVHEQHRDFWGPVRLLRKMLADVKRAGNLDFLITTSTADAEPLFKAGGFKPIGALRRYVLPLYRPYLGVTRLKSRSGLLAARPSVITQCDHNLLTSMCETGEYFRPEPTESFYGTRIPRMESLDGTWLRVSEKKEGDVPGFALLSREINGPQLLALADAFWNDGGVQLGRVVHSVANWARSQRFRRISLTTIQESRATHQLQRTGFVPREIRSLLLANQLSAVVPPPVEQWFLPGFALSGW